MGAQALRAEPEGLPEEPGAPLPRDRVLDVDEVLRLEGDHLRGEPAPGGLAVDADEAPDGDDSAGGAEEASIAALYRKLGEEQEATEDLGDDDLTDVHEHHARMTGIVQLCDDILKLLAVVEDTLVRLQTQHDSVVDKTSALHAECETLLADKLELEALASRIEGHLSVYDQLEGMQRQLAAPDFGVTSQAFMPLLVQADEAIAHLSKSAQFADSSAYLSRFRQVQARLLALVQAHVTGLLQSMTDKILLNTKAAAPKYNLLKTLSSPPN